MATEHRGTMPYWSAVESFPQFPPLTEDLATDVVVVGGGATGLSVAYQVARAGKRVVLLERDRCARGDTGHTTAHLTMVTDARLTELVERFGRSHAQAVWDAGLAAIAAIDQAVRDHEIDAAFEWVDGYLHEAPGQDDATSLADEAALAQDLGFDAEYVDAAPLFERPAIRYRDQARVHPLALLAGLTRAIEAMGGRIHERSAVDEFSDDPRSVRANGRTVRCHDVVIATHNPLVGLEGLTGATLLQTKLALYSSYAVAGRVAKGKVPDALWWDTADPYSYLRISPEPDADVVIFGGEDHKTGQETDTSACYQRLEQRLASLVPGIQLTHHWSGQVIETPDGLPYIGQRAPHEFVATGFVGNGLTFGTLAGLLIADAVLGRPNPWTDLFAPERKALTRGLWNYLTENADYPYYMLRDRFAGAETRPLRSVRRGEGLVLERQGAKVAVYRDVDGAVTQRSAICPHMGCVVAWNPAERTWDCPCHGSRFRPDGDVISGPAEAPLPPVD